ncbi:MAG: efflux RND transporter periplasmic adaptor subunit [Blastocatellia bacterium]
MKGVWGSCLLALVLAACRGNPTVSVNSATTAQASTPTAARPLAVEVYEVVAPAESPAQPIPAVISVEGAAAVLARRDGAIVRLDAQEGARVKQGQLLAQLEDDDSKAALRQAELEVTRLQYEEKQYEATIKVNRSELSRQQTLGREGITSQSEIERAQYKVEVSQQELEKTRLATRMAQARVEAAKLEVEKTILRAPINGIVTLRTAKLGSSVVRNDKLFEIAQLAPLEVRFQLAQSDAWQPQPGDVVPLALAGEARVAANARVQRRAPVADAASNARTYVALVTGNAALIPGTAVSVLRPPLPAAVGWWIPRAAFAANADLLRGGSALVFVVENGVCAPRTVVLNAVASDQVEIRSGLLTGEQVILMPPPDLKPGMRVVIGSL